MESIISVTHLQKQFGAFTAVDDLSFDIYRNEIFGLLGPNGAGKTTTIRMICGLLAPTGGTIRFDRGGEQKSLIGYCPQENIYYPKLTCYEQLVFIGHMYDLPGAVVKQRANDLLGVLGLSEKRDIRASKLSGGMKRRLNICLALIHDPEVLVLDEPEAGLDPQSRLLVRDFISDFGRRKTILLTTHNMDEADRLAGRIAIMDHGKLVTAGTPQELKKRVGQGDVLELVVGHADDDAVMRFAAQLGREMQDVATAGSSVLIRQPGVLNNLPSIRDAASNAGVEIAEIKLRENTLEDVFIQLTGRNLRV